MVVMATPNRLSHTLAGLSTIRTSKHGAPSGWHVCRRQGLVQEKSRREGQADQEDLLPIRFEDISEVCSLAEKAEAFVSRKGRLD